MGAEASCRLTFGRTKATGKALLETDQLIFRGREFRLAIPYKQISSVNAKDGTLRVTCPDGTAKFAIGAAAEKWAEKIRKPASRVDKLGVKNGQRICMVGLDDPKLRSELESQGASLVAVRTARDLDAIFYAAANRSALGTLKALASHLKPNGALWVIRPKGHPDISEMDVMKAGKAAGLVDVKVVRFSDTHTAEKFVIPVNVRRR